MKVTRKVQLRYALLCLSAPLIFACGGGGGDAGDSFEFEVIPKEIGYLAAKGDVNCRDVNQQTVFTINGGDPPFRIVNSHPRTFFIDKTEVTGKDPQFKLTLSGGCGEDLAVVVLDAQSRVATVSISIEKGEDPD